MMDKKKLKPILYNIYIPDSAYIYLKVTAWSIVKLYNLISLSKKVVVNYCYFKLLLVVN